MPDTRLVGVYDIDDERRARVADELGTRAYPNLQTLLSDSRAVTIAVPTRQHLEVGREALERDLDIFIEKPIASSLAEADALIRLARTRGRSIQVGHVERFNGAVRACEPYLSAPLFIESHRLAPFVSRGTDVTVVLDLMIHDIDLILSLVARPVVDLRAVGVSVLSPSVDIANARLEFAGGAVANITASRVSVERQRKIRFFQPTGYISLDLGRGTGEFYRRKTGRADSPAPTALTDIVERVSLRGDDREPLALELESFVDAVRGGRAVAVTAEEGRQALAVALDIVDHIERHRRHVLDSTTTGT
jgi:predicted dehydrogenase